MLFSLFCLPVTRSKELCVGKKTSDHDLALSLKCPESPREREDQCVAGYPRFADRDKSLQNAPAGSITDGRWGGNARYPGLLEMVSNAGSRDSEHLAMKKQNFERPISHECSLPEYFRAPVRKNSGSHSKNGVKIGNKLIPVVHPEPARLLYGTPLRFSILKFFSPYL